MVLFGHDTGDNLGSLILLKLARLYVFLYLANNPTLVLQKHVVFKLASLWVDHLSSSWWWMWIRRYCLGVGQLLCLLSMILLLKLSCSLINGHWRWKHEYCTTVSILIVLRCWCRLVWRLDLRRYRERGCPGAITKEWRLHLLLACWLLTYC